MRSTARDPTDSLRFILVRGAAGGALLPVRSRLRAPSDYVLSHQVFGILLARPEELRLRVPSSGCAIAVVDALFVGLRVPVGSASLRVVATVLSLLLKDEPRVDPVLVSQQGSTLLSSPSKALLAFVVSDSRLVAADLVDFCVLHALRTAKERRAVDGCKNKLQQVGMLLTSGFSLESGGLASSTQFIHSV